MRPTSSQSALLAALLLLLSLGAVLLASAAADPIQVQLGEPTPEGRAKPPKLPKLFDFDYFKSVFRKRYGSFLEELARGRYFMARALRAFVSAVNYAHRRAGHYNAVNDMSDRSPAEMALSRNRLMELEDTLQSPNSASAEVEELNANEPQLPEMLAAEDEDVERELAELLEERAEEPAFRELRAQMAAEADGRSRRRRRKREAPAQVRLRQLPLSRLINTGDQGAAEAAARAQAAQKPILRNPRSNNPNYEPFELSSFGLSDQEEQVKWWQVSRKSLQPVSAQLVKALHERELELAPSERALLPDEVFLDHRERGCLLEPRQQGTCGACYAFAVTTLMEWLLCQKSGKLVALSEQYMIDCGKGRFQGDLGGCDGGSVRGSALFVHNFGLELAKNYPYLTHEGQCPYDEDYDLKKTGFIRMELGDAVDVHAELWPRILAHSPIYVKAKTGADFLEYGGGVYLGAGCAPHTNHAMVLVGHGREDGEQYWLLRNSFGVKWGERGHWKLAKAAAARCLGESGVAFGTKTGLKYEVKPRNSRPRAKRPRLSE